MPKKKPAAMAKVIQAVEITKAVNNIIEAEGADMALEMLARQFIDICLQRQARGVSVNVQGLGYVSVQAYVTTLQGATWH